MSMSEPILAVSYGFGTNSTALLCGFYERGIKPDVILAADTGSEMPHSYAMLREMDDRAWQWWGMRIVVVRVIRKGNPLTLEQHCLKVKLLPALAYWSRNCSAQFKHDPIEKWLKAHCKQNGISEIKTAIGIGADEGGRILGKPTEKQLNKKLREVFWYPLAEWGWRREECRDAICRHGLTQPGKSACFFCPASKPSEVFNLAKNHPDLMARALAIEAAAQPNHRKLIGLGGEGNLWADWLRNDEAQGKLLDIEPMHQPCHCTD